MSLKWLNRVCNRCLCHRTPVLVFFVETIVSSVNASSFSVWLEFPRLHLKGRSKGKSRPQWFFDNPWVMLFARLTPNCSLTFDSLTASLTSCSASVETRPYFLKSHVQRFIAEKGIERTQVSKKVTKNNIGSAGDLLSHELQVTLLDSLFNIPRSIKCLHSSRRESYWNPC